MPVFVQSNAEAQRRWLITFSDLISLLLAFFVMLPRMARTLTISPSAIPKASAT